MWRDKNEFNTNFILLIFNFGEISPFFSISLPVFWEICDLFVYLWKKLWRKLANMVLPPNPKLASLNGKNCCCGHMKLFRKSRGNLFSTVSIYPHSTKGKLHAKVKSGKNEFNWNGNYLKFYKAVVSNWNPREWCNTTKSKLKFIANFI